jgi:hypothetical protein
MARVIEIPKFIIQNITKILPCPIKECPLIKSVVNHSFSLVQSRQNEISMLLLLFIYFFLLFLTGYVSMLHRYNQRSVVQLVMDTKKPSEYTNAILIYLSKLDSLQHLVCNGNFYISYDNQEFRLTSTIIGRFFVSNDHTMVIEFYSHVQKADKIRDVLDKIYLAFQKRQQPQSVYIPFRSGNRHQIQFMQKSFESDMSLDLLEVEQNEISTKQIRFYIEHPEWYQKKSFPHTLGVLIHGPSNCGKTSYAKAIANESGRHVILISSDSSITEQQLDSLLFDEEIIVYDKSTKMEQYQIIPFEERLYVFENLDRITKKKMSMFRERLNSVLESSERFIIFTAENINKIHPQLFTAGRIDVCVDLGTCSVSKIVNMVQEFYDLEDHLEEWSETLVGGILTPGEVHEILLRHPTDSSRGMLEIGFAFEKVSMESQTEVKESSDQLVFTGTNEPISVETCNTIPIESIEIEKEVNSSLEIQKEIDLNVSEDFKKELVIMDFNSDSSLPSDDELFDEHPLTTSQFLQRVVKAEIKEVIELPDLSSKNDSYADLVKKSIPSYISKLTDKKVSVEKVQKVENDGNTLESSVILDDFFQVKRT